MSNTTPDENAVPLCYAVRDGEKVEIVMNNSKGLHRFKLSHNQAVNIMKILLEGLSGELR